MERRLERGDEIERREDLREGMRAGSGNNASISSPEARETGLGELLSTAQFTLARSPAVGGSPPEIFHSFRLKLPGTSKPREKLKRSQP
jgi:hypothetical protein